MPRLTRNLFVSWRFLISAAWMFVLLAPYPIVGETWGMVWFLATYPLSEWLKPIWDTSVSLYVIVVTILHGAAVYGFLSGGLWFLDKLFPTRPLAPERAEVAHEQFGAEG